MKLKLLIFFSIVFMLFSISHAQRNLDSKTLGGVVSSAGFSCNRAVKPYYQGNVTGTGHEFWNITCDKIQYQVYVKENGQTKIMPCNLVLTATGNSCYTKTKDWK